MKLENYEVIRDMNESNDAVGKLGNKFKDEQFLEDLATKEPERLAYDKLLSKKSNDPGFIMSVLPNNKDVIKYMAPSLKEDAQFLTYMVKKYPGTLGDVLKNCNVRTDENGNIVIDQVKIEKENNLIKQAIATGTIAAVYANNEKFMSAAIAKDASMVLLLSEELKNNKEFIKVEAMKSDEVLEQIAENTDKFGEDGLSGAKDASMEKGLDYSITTLETQLENITTHLRAQGLTEEQINEDIIVKGVKKELDKVRGYTELGNEEKMAAYDKYAEDMVNSGNEDLLPEEAIKRASIQNKIAQGIKQKMKGKAERTLDDAR